MNETFKKAPSVMDMQKLAEKDRIYSLLLSPISAAILAFSAGLLTFGFTPGVVVTSACVAFINMMLHPFLGWSEFASNWKLLYRVPFDEKTTFHVLKDGARRTRVVLDDRSFLKDMATKQLYSDEVFKRWVRSASPEEDQSESQGRVLSKAEGKRSN